MTFKNFMKELSGKDVEGEIIKSVFISVITSLILLGVLYFLVLENVENLIPKYGFYLLFAVLSYAIIISCMRQVRAYKDFACMSGMMIGMTLGMIAGFLSGFYVGATNGMFYGGIFGMIIGILMGIWNGSCCGIMGIIEGIMAGFMGGLMGAMTALMLLNDHLKAMGVIVFIISSLIMLSLIYMVYKETKETERQRK